jgi:hypothetical protein
LRFFELFWIAAYAEEPSVSIEELPLFFDLVLAGVL